MRILLQLLICTALRAHIIVVEALYKIKAAAAAAAVVVVVVAVVVVAVAAAGIVV